MNFSSSKESERKTFNEINITPLTDIFLVLLIIMMVIAPLLDQQGLNLAVPNMIEVQDEIKDSTAEITKDKLTFDELVDNVKDGMNDWFNDFKTKFEENKAVKTASIIIGTITGVLLIYGVYLLIRKFIKWLK